MATDQHRSEAIGWLVSSVGRDHLERQIALAEPDYQDIADVLRGWLRMVPQDQRLYFAEQARSVLERLVAFADSKPWTGLSDDESAQQFVVDAKVALRIV